MLTSNLGLVSYDEGSGIEKSEWRFYFFFSFLMNFIMVIVVQPASQSNYLFFFTTVQHGDPVIHTCIQ